MREAKEAEHEKAQESQPIIGGGPAAPLMITAPGFVGAGYGGGYAAGGYGGGYGSGYM